MKNAQEAELKQLKASLKAQEEAAAAGADSIQKAAFGSAIGGKAGMAGLLSIIRRMPAILAASAYCLSSSPSARCPRSTSESATSVHEYTLGLTVCRFTPWV